MPTAPKDSPPLEGSLIAGKYRVTREIGRGGMAFVYEGLHHDIQKRVAIKILSAEFITSQVVVERFLREARAAAAVRSPYICDVYDSGKLEDGRPFLVMELLEGESLYERMVRVRLFDPETTVRVVTHAARGLTKAHAAGIVHRDLKPENIFLTTNEDGQLEAKILDFGLAKFYAPVNDGEGQARLTREGAIFGTPAYMSPEQVKGQGAVDHRADVWALGCIVYECFTGRTVWSTEQGVAMTFAQIASSPIPRITKHRPDLPASLDVWFDRALSRDIEQRYQTPKDLADGLAAALDTGPLSSLSQSAPSLRIPSMDLGEGDLAPMTPPPDPLETLGSLAPPVSVEEAPGSRKVRDAPSIVDNGTSQPVLTGAAPAKTRGSLPFVAIGAGVFVAVFGILAVTRPWQGTGPGVPSPLGSAAGPATSASAEPTAATSSSAGSLPAASANLPKWVTTVNGAQAQLASGDIEGSTKAFKEALDSSGAAPARNLMEHANATAANKGPCKLSGITRLRSWTLSTGTVSRPILLHTSRGYLALWTDDHEATGHDHAYAVALDAKLRPFSSPVDVTPEADDLGRFTAATVDGRVLLVYADSKGTTAGIYMRWLDEAGTIAGPSVAVAPVRAANAQVAVATGHGTHWVVWDEERDGDGSDLFARKLEANGPAATEVRMTDFLGATVKTRVSAPQMALAGSSLELVMRVERDVARPIMFVHVGEPNVALKEGLGEPVPGHKADRAAGSMRMLTPAKERGDAPSIACATDACFVAWHGEKVGTSTGGGFAGFIDAKTGQLLWSKKFVTQGGKPSVGMGPKGEAAIAWFEQGRVRLAPLGREGVGAPSVLARVAGDQPRPSVAMGATAKEWGVAWLDFEAGKLEPYALTASCPLAWARAWRTPGRADHHAARRASEEPFPHAAARTFPARRHRRTRTVGGRRRLPRHARALAAVGAVPDRCRLERALCGDVFARLGARTRRPLRHP